MDAGTRRSVRTRAKSRCEYCRLHEDDDLYTFHIEHIVAIKHGGSDEADNLALACHQCNLHKGPNLSGIDPESGNALELFHLRHDRWSEHFMYHECEVVGIAPTGRATVRVLNMNDEDRIQFRIEIGFRG